ncbi:hypothetical protein ABT075_16040 [Streptomyces sp. NPDC002677]
MGQHGRDIVDGQRPGSIVGTGFGGGLAGGFDAVVVEQSVGQR